ncbi:DinB family protein [Planococcus sp. SSTMD024]|uniref:DinB family protein n=1 Tax=Planococcus sp. SSTMD024 TaxID=3242163 RepID=UPI00351EA8CB
MEQQQVLQAFDEYEVYMESLQKTLSEPADAYKPIADGKWSIAQMVMHLAEWDRFIRSERLPHMTEGAHLEPLPEVDEFNRRAIDKAETMDFPAIITQAIEERRLLKEQLASATPSQWNAVFYVDDQDMTMGRYFGDLTKHDAHHFKQINTFLT